MLELAKTLAGSLKSEILTYVKLFCGIIYITMAIVVLTSQLDGRPVPPQPGVHLGPTVQAVQGLAAVQVTSLSHGEEPSNFKSPTINQMTCLMSRVSIAFFLVVH